MALFACRTATARSKAVVRQAPSGLQTALRQVLDKISKDLSANMLFFKQHFGIAGVAGILVRGLLE